MATAIMSQGEVAIANDDAKLLDQLKYNKWLPAELLQGAQAEVADWKQVMISGFEKAVREDDLGAANVACRLLMKYIIRLGYLLTIEDKERLCPLIYKMIFHERATFDFQEKMAVALTSLIVAKETLNVQFDWKLIHKVLEKYYFRQFRSLLYAPPHSHASALVKLASAIRRYFGPTATDEIWSTFRPQMCPNDHKIHEAQGFLCLFMPTDTGRFEWIEEVLAMWEWIENNPLWDKNFILLLSRLAHDSADKIDWTPYLPIIFTRILRVFDLPVGGPISNYDKFPMQNCDIFCDFSACKSYMVDEAAYLIVNMISPLSKEPVNYLRKLLKSVESFYHPSNIGSWSMGLAKFLNALASLFAQRLRREASAHCKTPKAFKLTSACCEEFVNMILPLALTAMYSKSPQAIMLATLSLKHLAYTAPAVILPSIVERVTHALQTLTETHQTSAAIEALSVIIIPLLNKKINPKGDLSFLAELLHLILPGIDPNDGIKTYVTSKFVISFASVVPLFALGSDASSATRTFDGMSFDDSDANIEHSAPSAIHVIEDWCVAFLNRVLETMFTMNPPSQAKVKNQQNQFDELPLLASVVGIFFQQLSPALRKTCLNKVVEFIDQNFLPNASKPIGDILMAATLNGDKSAASLGPVVNVLYKKIVDSKSSKLNNLTDSELQYYLTLLGKAVRRNNGLSDDKIRKQVTTIVSLVWKSSTSKPVLKVAGKVLRQVINSLTTVYLTEFRSQAPAVWESDAFKRDHWKYWGELCTLNDINPSWHIPSAADIDAATEIFNTFVEEPVAAIKKYIAEQQQVQKDSNNVTASASSTNSTTSSASHQQKNAIINALAQLRFMLRGASLLLPELDKNILKDYTRTQNEREITLPRYTASLEKLKYNRQDLADLIHQASQVATQQQEVDAAVLTALIKNIYTLVAYRYQSYSKYSRKKKGRAYSRKHLFRTNIKKDLMPRCFMLFKVNDLLDSRIFQHIVPCTQTHVDLIADLSKLSTGTYSKVRSKAQASLINMLRIFHKRLTIATLTPFIDLLANPNVSSDELNGAIYTLHREEPRDKILNDWDLLSLFLLNICKCTKVEKPTIQSRLNSLFVYYTVRYKELRFDYSTDACNNNVALQQQQVASKIDKYHKLIDDLLDLLKNPALHWRYQQMILTNIILLIRSDRAVMYPMRPIRQFLKTLVADIVTLRDGSVKALNLIFAQYKPIQPKKLITFDSTSQVEAKLQFKAMIEAPIQSDADFKASTLFDKNYFGWNVLPESVHCYDYSKAIDSENERAASTAALVSELKPLVLDKEWLSKFFNLFALEPRTAIHSFNNTMAQLFKGFFQLFKSEFLESCKSIIEQLLTHSGSGKPEERSHTILAAEWIAGFARGCKHWSYDERVTAQQYMVQILKPALAKCSQSSILDWQSCLRFCTYDFDTRRCSWLTDLFVDNLNLEYGTSAQQAKALHCLYPVISEYSSRDKELINRVTQILLKYLSHPYQQVRDMIAMTLTLMPRYYWQPLRDEKTGKPILITNGNTQQATAVQVNEHVRQLIQSFKDQFDKLKQEYKQTVAEQQAKQAQEAQQQQQQGENDKAAPPQQVKTQQPAQPNDLEDNAYKALSKTIVHWLSYLFRTGAAHVLYAYLPVIVPSLVGVFEVPDQDLEATTAKTFIHLASSILPSHRVEEVMQLITMLLMAHEAQLQQQANNQQQAPVTVAAAAASWKVRASILTFIQIFGYRHHFYVLQEGKQELLFQDIMTLLRDKTLEVREAACTTLSGFIKIAQDKKVQELVQFFTKAAKESLPSGGNKQQQQVAKTPEAQKIAAQAHFAVLGLSAIIRAYPYDIPEFLPKLLTQLTNFYYRKNIGQHVSNTVRKTIADFMKYHKDLWHVHKTKFTDEELHVLSELTSQNYYA